MVQVYKTEFLFQFPTQSLEFQDPAFCHTPQSKFHSVKRLFHKALVSRVHCFLPRDSFRCYAECGPDRKSKCADSTETSREDEREDPSRVAQQSRHSPFGICFPSHPPFSLWCPLASHPFLPALTPVPPAQPPCSQPLLPPGFTPCSFPSYVPEQLGFLSVFDLESSHPSLCL